MQHRANTKSLTGLKGLNLNEMNMDEIGDNHFQTAADTPMRPDAFHMCLASRGIRDTYSATVTAFYEGQFVNNALKEEFLRYAGMTTVY
ncbi:hypothetical protein A4D02_16695 [Niastella koreensis]|uniref:GTP cyclohydrolase I/Nitrile oxidoreductase n=2 Tax=Niastella koreensis TaxID=354356 RepID=G8TKH2_NIAKG|nr:GTP cyclohydrolase I [Niastella koreensis]AEV97628.1 GTP cyclohydrolase I/Nitrile oxidoreductase [Niastella koreensis GR20-10]OQP40546.1 hypothetical protein A4D02_16695 [Niastella koreensis]